MVEWGNVQHIYCSPHPVATVLKGHWWPGKHSGAQGAGYYIVPCMLLDMHIYTCTVAVLSHASVTNYYTTYTHIS